MTPETFTRWRRQELRVFWRWTSQPGRPPIPEETQTVSVLTTVAAALVGTFLGVLLAYGFVQPLGTIVETLNQREARYFECLKAGILALARSVPSVIAVEFARRTITSDVRPSFKDMENVL